MKLPTLIIAGIIMFIGMLFPLTLFSIDRSVLDSLFYMLETDKTDSAKVYHLVEISKQYESIDLSMSLKYSEKALEISNKSENKDLIAYSLKNMGVACFNLGLLEMAVQYFYRYLEIIKSSHDKRNEATALVNLGATRLQLMDFRQAIINFERALKIFNQSTEQTDSKKSIFEILTIYNNLGVAYQNLKEYPQAMDYYSRGVILARRSPGQEEILAKLLNNIGSLNMDLHKMDDALSALDEAMEIRNKNNDKSGLALSYRLLAKFYIANGNYDRALEYVYKGYSIAEQIGMNYVKASFTEWFFDIYNKKNNSDSALKYHVLFSQLKDSLNTESAKKELSRLELSAQFQEKEKLRELEQKRKELWYLLIGLTLVLSAFILGLLYFLSQSRVRRLRLEKENINLTSKNLELEKLNLERELELRNKELATNVMYQIQKNELINEIVEKLQSQAGSDKKLDHNWILEIVRDLEKTQEKFIWNEFEIRFKQVHNEFYNKLNKINPELSVNERRLCAFLRLNMTTKEISSITGQTPRTIDVARTRLRKKLMLTNSDLGLVEFLSTI